MIRLPLGTAALLFLPSGIFGACNMELSSRPESRPNHPFKAQELDLSNEGLADYFNDLIV